MRHSIWILLFGVILTCSRTARAQYFPPVGTGSWETVDPGQLGWDGVPPAELFAWLELEDTKAFLVLQGGRIVLEHYFGDFEADSSWVWYSAGKSLMAALVGIAQDEGLLSLDDPTSNYLGRWTLTTRVREDAITLRHQLTMTSGLDETVAFACTLRACLQYRTDPGTRWVYHNGPYNLLTNVVEAASGQDITVFTESRLGSKIGLHGYWEPVLFNNFFHSTARGAARFGLLVARGGAWDGTAILADAGSLTQPSQGLNPSYGHLWWLNGQSSYIPPGDSTSFDGPIAPGAPPDVFVAAGAQGQFVSVAPSLDLVVVRLGEGRATDLVPLEFHDQMWQRLLAVMGTGTGTGVAPIQPEQPDWSASPNPASDRVYIRTGEFEGRV
ncbi:beta-lactamase family protein, partial [Rhodothermus sp. AH-315-K08]|nr:beta-lactamase family protein [Rhodothermus sp. AH-315-K08]